MLGTAAAGRTAAGPRRALVALCVTEIVSYGVLYYAFPVLAQGIAEDTGWSRTAVTAAFSAGNLLGAVAGVPVGRLLGRRGPRPVMTAGSLLAVAALAGVAEAPSYGWFLAAWLVVGVAMAGVFYPPAFAALTGWYGPRRLPALTTLTLAAGFSSTIFAPLTAALTTHLNWREVYLVLAAILATITIPAHAWALSPPWRPDQHPAPSHTGPDPAPQRRDDRQVLTSRLFLLLVAAMTLSAFALYAVVVNLVPLLTGRGLSTTFAAWAIGLGGAGQVAGRLCYRPLATRLTVRGRTAAVIGAGGLAILVLGILPGPAFALVAVAVLVGAIRGMFTLVEATIVADLWGTQRFARLNGVFNAPVTAATALAPSIGAALAAAMGSYPLLFVTLAAAGGLGAALATAATTATTATPRPTAAVPAGNRPDGAAGDGHHHRPTTPVRVRGE
ncbi:MULTISPECIES: MFS transporter [Pseudofrankia]|uniref:MFS transporter n=1 Tax=Pseudofrankia TaxID=2994363 RepID=UPI000234B146|nr:MULTISPECIES: MFS transporter [Pseudofrankia]OHV31827.1 MFS transporter [Pseudofrankia sp. EUN1h]